MPESPIDNDEPAPKRRRMRMPKSCEPCRRKKVKCDGEEPCSACASHNEECLYLQKPKPRPRPEPELAQKKDAHLEDRVHRLESLLTMLLPDGSKDDKRASPGIDMLSDRPGKSPRPEQDRQKADQSASDLTQERNRAGTPPENALLESMLEAAGNIERDDRGSWSYVGQSSGQSFLRQLRDRLGIVISDEFGRNMRGPATPIRGALAAPIEQARGRALPLPPKEVTDRLLDVALEEACTLMRVVHRPTWESMVERIYTVEPSEYGKIERDFLPSLYAALAVGYIFEPYPLGTESKVFALQNGTKYFVAAQQTLDIANSCNLESLQTLAFMIVFLQCIGQLATCHTYCTMALSCVLQMGLHRDLPRQANCIQIETGRRIFWFVRKLENYSGAMLGLPRLLNQQDIDQALPSDVDDEFITRDRVLPMPAGTISVIAAGNAHTNAYKILYNILDKVYPPRPKQVEGRGNSPTYGVPDSVIRSVEKELQQWLDDLPAGLRPTKGGDPRKQRVLYYLRMSFSYIQLVLYRPFLYHISISRTSNPSNANRRAYECAAACVRVSKNIVYILQHMYEENLLHGEFWFVIYTAFFAIMSLAFFILENPKDARVAEVIKDAHMGRTTMQALAKHSLWADRCCHTLNSVFQHFPPSGNATVPTRTVASSAPTASALPSTVPTKNRPSMSSPSTSAPSSYQSTLIRQPFVVTQPPISEPVQTDNGKYQNVPSPSPSLFAPDAASTLLPSNYQTGPSPTEFDRLIGLPAEPLSYPQDLLTNFDMAFGGSNNGPLMDPPTGSTASEDLSALFSDTLPPTLFGDGEMKGNDLDRFEIPSAYASLGPEGSMSESNDRRADSMTNTVGEDGLAEAQGGAGADSWERAKDIFRQTRPTWMAYGWDWPP